MLTYETKLALLTPDWELCIFRPAPDNMGESLLWGGARYWTLSEHEKRERWYIRPRVLLTSEYPVAIYDTKEEALDAWISEHIRPPVTGRDDTSIWRGDGATTNNPQSGV